MWLKPGEERFGGKTWCGSREQIGDYYLRPWNWGRPPKCQLAEAGEKSRVWRTTTIPFEAKAKMWNHFCLKNIITDEWPTLERTKFGLLFLIYLYLNFILLSYTSTLTLLKETLVILSFYILFLKNELAYWRYWWFIYFIETIKYMHDK